MKSVYYLIIIWVGLPYSYFIFTDDSLNLEGVMRQIGKYLFTKTLIDVVYIQVGPA